MARNQEKKMELFSKWTQFKKDAHSGVSTHRPHLASECDSVTEAEKWRREMVRDITKKIAAIQNSSLGEHRIRELNDEINKLMSRKYHWEKRIRELGGSDYSRMKAADVDGKALPGAPNYKYYGAAKDLPGVKELFVEEAEFHASRKGNRMNKNIHKHLNPEYYGFRDDEDGLLVPKEHAAQVRHINDALLAFSHKRQKLEDEVRQSSGAFGARELADLVDLGDEHEVKFLLSSAFRESFIAGQVAAAAEMLNPHHSVAAPRQSSSTMLSEAEEIDQKKLALLSRIL
jgi:pre-mRNA-splicing factor ISY1